jgi:hypothetical protein
VLGVVGVVLISLTIWVVKPKKPMSVFILNKTVPTKQRYDHRAINWVLKHEKYSKSNGKLYSLEKDYFGFFPLDAEEKKFDFKSLALQDIEIVADTSDLVYYADTYGVYYSDWYANHIKVNPQEKVYGGLNNNDYLLLKKMKEANKNIITEFVLLDKPTSELVREKTEDLFGLRWEGWVGRYFHSLDNTSKENVPAWIVDLYKEQNNGKWPYHNAGIVLVHKYGKVLVLENNNHISHQYPVIQTNKEYASKYNLPDTVNYSFWFDIVSSDKGTNDTLSLFKLKTTSLGDSLLNANRLNSEFPAVLVHNKDYRFYYFAGDFADSNIEPWSAYFAGIQHAPFLFSSKRKYDRRRFFWEYYNPLMKTILKNMRNAKN